TRRARMMGMSSRTRTGAIVSSATLPLQPAGRFEVEDFAGQVRSLSCQSGQGSGVEGRCSVAGGVEMIRKKHWAYGAADKLLLAMASVGDTSPGRSVHAPLS